MSKIREPSRFKKKLAGKGFYIALAVCLLVVAGIAFATFSDSLNSVKKPEDSQGEDAGKQPVAEPKEGVKDPRVTTTTATTAQTTVPTTAATTAAPNPLFVLPGSNEVTKSFSGDTPVYSATMGDWRCHTGADFGGNEGMTVKAVADGTVKSVSEDPVFGETVVIDHGFGVQSRYCGVTATVKAGEKVSAASPIGTLSGVPCESADGCHLHLEITVNGAYTDPVKTIDKAVKYRKAE